MSMSTKNLEQERKKGMTEREKDHFLMRERLISENELKERDEERERGSRKKKQRLKKLDKSVKQNFYILYKFFY